MTLWLEMTILPTHHSLVLLDSESWDISCWLSGSVCILCPSDQTTRQNIYNSQFSPKL